MVKEMREIIGKIFRGETLTDRERAIYEFHYTVGVKR